MTISIYRAYSGQIVLLVALALLLLAAGAAADFALRSWLLRVRLWWRFRRARQGQTDAETLLTRLGYRIVDRQAQTQVVLSVDGELRPAIVQTDLLVERKGRRAVVEVKTGQRAPDPSYIPTRRQLLEYTLAFPEHDIILLDMETRSCHAIRFPDLEARRSPGRPRLPVGLAAAAFLAGLLAGPAYHALRQDTVPLPQVASPSPDARP